MTDARHLRDWAATFANLAAAMADEAAARSFDTMASVCRESAARIERRGGDAERPPAHA